MKPRHGNIALFVPHVGCPCRCSFCDQNAIAQATAVPTAEEVANACRTALQAEDDRTLELAFFGGSFTAIDPALMLSLLSAAQPFLGGKIKGIRISTRPDCVDTAVLQQLKSLGVTAIELGVQSFDDAVLQANNRGHTAAQALEASALVKSFGFALGHQMMTGLWQSTPQCDWQTAQKIVACQPQTVRIYPTLVLQSTSLADWFAQGRYQPQTLEQAVTLTAQLLELFSQNGIRVIRMGLHSELGMQSKIVAGPFHPAFGELCEGRLMLERLLPQLAAEKAAHCCSSNVEPPLFRASEKGASLREQAQKPKHLTVLVHPADISKMAGHKRCNLTALQDLGYSIKIKADLTAKPLVPTLFNNRNGGRAPCV